LRVFKAGVYDLFEKPDGHHGSQKCFDLSIYTPGEPGKTKQRVVGFFGNDQEMAVQLRAARVDFSESEMQKIVAVLRAIRSDLVSVIREHAVRS
jgi:hypothetical protein